MITPKRVTIIIISLFVILIGSVSPVYCVSRLEFKFYPSRNRTLLGLVHTGDRDKVEKISFSINNVAIPFTAFMTVIICTITLVVKLKHKTKWRQQSTASVASETLFKRDQKVSTMIVMISTLFIFCFTPITITFIGMLAWPEFTIDGRYRNMFIIFFSFGFILESANSSVNIFIYYRMSSKYRAVFRQLFWMNNTNSNRQPSRASVKTSTQ